MPTWTSDRDVLVRSSLPLVNAALAAGHAAQPAVTQHVRMAAELERRLARPLPPEASREYRWAMENRARCTAEVKKARALAATLTERWARLMDQIIDTCPERTGDVDYAVWGAGPQAGEEA